MKRNHMQMGYGYAGTLLPLKNPGCLRHSKQHVAGCAVLAEYSMKENVSQKGIVGIILSLNSDVQSERDRVNEIDTIMSDLFDAGFMSVPEGVMSKCVGTVGDVVLSLDYPDLDKPNCVIALRRLEEQSNMIMWSSSAHDWRLRPVIRKFVSGKTVMIIMHRPEGVALPASSPIESGVLAAVA